MRGSTQWPVARPVSASAVAIALVLASGASVQTGAAVATLLFPRVGPLGVVTLRLALAAVILLLALRPKVRGYAHGDWLLVLGFAVSLAGMNALFYEAIARIPLGAAVTVEMLGPLLLSVVLARRWLGALWAAVALAGIVALSGGAVAGLDPAGAGFALAAGAMWAGYILANSRVGQRFPGTDGLALAMPLAALLILSLGIWQAGSDLLVPSTIGIGAAVALLSSAVPYSLEMAALRRVPAATFSMLLSLMPAIAALAGFAVLGQRLGGWQLLGIVLVVLASAGAVRMAPRRAP